MISNYDSLSSFMRRLNTIKKKYPEIPVISIYNGQLNALTLGYANLTLDSQTNDTVLTPKEFEELQENTNYTLVIVLGRN